MEGLFNPISILLHTLNTAALFTAIYFLLYRPVKRFLDNRRQSVIREIDEARAAREDADSLIKKSRERQNEAFLESVDRAAKIQEQAEENARQIIDAARLEASRIIEDAHGAAAEAAERSKREMREFATDMAVSISERILGREITGEDHVRLINEFLEEVN